MCTFAFYHEHTFSLRRPTTTPRHTNTELTTGTLPIITLALTPAISVHSNHRTLTDGVEFSQDGAVFTYDRGVPTILQVYTVQEAGYSKARGPWRGNTEVHITGTHLFPSEHLKARFVAETETESETREATHCFFDTPECIRCISPLWYPIGGTSTRNLGGNILPCFVTSVDVSNDGGAQWSLAHSDKFLYCPVYVSTYGSNAVGQGTPRLPFRDISRAIMATLSEPRAYFLRKGKDASGAERTGRQQRGVEIRGQGLIDYINFDQILLMDGVYRNGVGKLGIEQNLNLSPGGRIIEIIAQHPGYAYIDCNGGNIDATRPFDIDDVNQPDAEQHGSLTFKDVGTVRCSGSIRWETYDFHWRGATTTRAMRVDFV